MANPCCTGAGQWKTITGADATSCEILEATPPPGISYEAFWDIVWAANYIEGVAPLTAIGFTTESAWAKHLDTVECGDVGPPPVNGPGFYDCFGSLIN